MRVLSLLLMPLLKLIVIRLVRLFFFGRGFALNMANANIDLSGEKPCSTMRKLFVTEHPCQGFLQMVWLTFADQLVEAIVRAP